MSDWHRITLSQTNCYLLKVKDGFMLVDCGNAHDKKTFLNTIQTLGIAMTDIRYLFLTHHHNDHCGLLHELVSKNPEIKVILSEKCAAYLRVGTHQKHIKQRYASRMLELVVGIFVKLNRDFSEEFTPYVTRSNDVVVKENDVLPPDMGIQGKILRTPGHTEDSISLVIRDVAFVGDAARNVLNGLGASYLPILMYDREICYSSWLKIAAEAKTICPAHGKCFGTDELNKHILT